MSLLNYFNFKKFGTQILLTNDVGRYIFLEKEEFKQFVKNSIPEEGELFQELSKNWFLSADHPEVFCSQVKDDLRESKNHLFQATSLFIFVVTTRCNMRCVYCQARAGVEQSITKDMDVATARRAIEIVLSSPSKSISIEFQGGEPLLNYPVVKEIIEYCNYLNHGEKTIHYSLVSNLTLLDEEMLSFFIKEGVSLSTSFDGPQNVHDQNRPNLQRRGTFDDVTQKISWIRNFEGGSIGAIQTTSKYSLAYPKETVDTYLQAGLDYIFIRPLTPLGTARHDWDNIGYTPEEFVEFYSRSLEYILELNKRGYKIREGHAIIWLRKILDGRQENYMELRSPCGASVGQIAFYGDGRVFTCDEARMLSEMGNDIFELGDVQSCSYCDLMDSITAKITCSASILEVLPECCDCVYQPYCGTCPVVNLFEGGNIFPRSAGSYRCKIYRGMLDQIFSILQRQNLEELEILRTWL
jgi:His-Xaa-Ser system radical SAM maturase HxsB